MDRVQATLRFEDLSSRRRFGCKGPGAETWLRERLSGTEGGLIAETVIVDPAKTVALIHSILAHLQRRRTVKARPAVPLPPLVVDFHDKTAAFGDFIRRAGAHEEDQ